MNTYAYGEEVEIFANLYYHFSLLIPIKVKLSSNLVLLFN